MMAPTETKSMVLHYVDLAKNRRFCQRCSADVFDKKADAAFTTSIREYEHPRSPYMPCYKVWVE